MPRTTAKPTFEALRAELADPDYKVRKQALRTMARYYRDRASGPLLDMLNDPRGEVRSRTLQVLTKLGDARVVPRVREMLGDTHARVRVQALNSLYKLAPQQSFDMVLRMLHDSSKLVRGCALQMLGWLGDARAVPVLLELLDQAQGKEIVRIVYALGSLGDARASAPLLALLDRPDADQFAQAVTSALYRVAGTDEQVFERLLALVKDSTKHTSVRVPVIGLLGNMQRPEAAPTLIRALTEKDPSLRWHLALVLGRLRNTCALEPLVQLLDDENETVQQYTLWALQQFGALEGSIANRAIARALSYLSTTDTRLACAAAPFLIQQKDSCVLPALLKAYAATSDCYVRRSIITALGNSKDPRVFEILLRGLQTAPAHERSPFIIALGVLGDLRAVEPLLALLDVSAIGTTGYYSQWMLLRALVQLGDRRALEPLRAFRDQLPTNARAFVEHALKTLGAA